MSTPSYFDRHPQSSSTLPSRPGPSPHTPGRTASNLPLTPSTPNLASPSLSYRHPGTAADDDPVILSFSTRFLCAGFGGETAPRCCIPFNAGLRRRVGDYGAYIPEDCDGSSEQPRKRKRRKEKVDDAAWGAEVEGWSMDLHRGSNTPEAGAGAGGGGGAGVSVGLTGDLVERAVREAYTRSLLLDTKTRRVVLVLPEVLPRELLQRVLRVLFEVFVVPAVTVLGRGVASCVAAGMRSGLVCHVGWRESVVSAVYEYRVVREGRSERGYRGVVQRMGKMVEWTDAWARTGRGEVGGWMAVEDVAMTVEEAEEVARRTGWCRGYRRGEEELDDADLQMVEIPSVASSSESLKLPFGAFADVVEDAFFIPSPSHEHHNDKPDDHELPLQQLLFKCLLALPPDVRAVCMSRVMFTGSGSNIPGFKQRVLNEVSALIQQRGFDPVEGKAADERRRREREQVAKRREAARKALPSVAEDGKPSASEAPQVVDEIDLKLMRQAEKFVKPLVAGVVRGIETLGAWAGASLFGGLRVKGVVAVERDAFLQYGLAGANKRDSGPAAGVAGMGAARKSYAGADVTGKAGGIDGERSGWTLGAWA